MPRLVIMAKLPRAGGVKTRLARAIGDVEALRFYRHALHNTVIRLSGDPRWQTILAVTPDNAIEAHGWPCGLIRVAQGSGDLGARMHHLMTVLPPGPVIIVGSDIPGLCRSVIARAFAALGGSDAVFGPANDGGYYLVGLKRLPAIPVIFHNVRWSSPFTLKDSVANLGCRAISYVEELPDIDEGRDYEAWRTAGGDLLLSVRSSAA